jgi:hypothetical protein
MSDITRIPAISKYGNSHAADELFPLAFDAPSSERKLPFWLEPRGTIPQVSIRRLYATPSAVRHRRTDPTQHGGR